MGLNTVAFVVVLMVPALRQWFALVLPDALVFFAAIGVAALAAGVLEAGWQAVHVASELLKRHERGESFPFLGGLPPRLGPPQSVSRKHTGGGADDT